MNYTTLSVEEHGQAKILEILERRIFLQITDKFRDEILTEIDKDVDQIIIDLSKVSVMNSAGLGVLLQAHDKIKKRSGRLIIAGLQPVMQDIFLRMKLDSFFEVCKNKEEGLKKIQGGK